MENSLKLADSLLLAPAEIDTSALGDVLGSLLSKEVDYADLYLQAIQQESWALEDSIVKDGSFTADRGVGIRAQSGEKTGFAYAGDIVLPAITSAAQAARSITRQGQSGQVNAWQKTGNIPLYYKDHNPLMSLQDSDKIAILQDTDSYIRGLDKRIKEVSISISGLHDIMMVLASDGTLAADVRPLVRFGVNIIVEENGRREQASAGGGGRFDYRYFSQDKVRGFADEALRQALVNLEAIDAPAGMMPVVLGPGWPGVLLHEAIGHGLEGDFNRKKTSAFSDRIGERIASPLCTVVDDATLSEQRGSLSVDDEGVVGQNTVLIENGILKGYMQDKTNARLMGVDSTGNGRRESFAHLPLPRMTNTYMLPGPHKKDEIISSVKKGLYAVNFAGGQVDITSGQFVFAASEAYLIEDGKVTAPVKGATLIGSGPEVLTKVSMVADDLALDKGVGTCGKDGQSVPVCVDQPTLLVDEITVGGTSC